jgi:hypothetical protein
LYISNLAAASTTVPEQKMNEIDRRAFIKALGAGTAAAMLPASIQRALAIPAHNATGTLMDVEHVVILMQENRSFDHYLGTLQGVRGFNDPRAVKLSSGNSVWQQPTGSGSDYVLPFHPSTPVSGTTTAPDMGITFIEDLDHGWQGTHLAWNQRPMGPVGARQDRHDHGLPDARGHPVPLRARRRLHDLRRLPLLADGTHRSEPLLHVDRLGRQRR